MESRPTLKSVATSTRNGNVTKPQAMSVHVVAKCQHLHRLFEARTVALEQSTLSPELREQRIKMEAAIFKLKEHIKNISTYQQASLLLLTIARSLDDCIWDHAKGTKLFGLFAAVAQEFYEAAILLDPTDNAADEWSSLKVKAPYSKTMAALARWNENSASEKPSLKNITTYLLRKVDECIVQVNAIAPNDAPLCLAYLLYKLAEGIEHGAFLGKSQLYLFDSTIDTRKRDFYSRILEATEFMRLAGELHHPKAGHWLSLNTRLIVEANHHTKADGFLMPSILTGKVYK